MAHRVFLTTLSELPAQLSKQYYYSQSGGVLQYYAGAYSAEPAAKHVLTNYGVDRIVILGTDKTYDEKDLIGAHVLSDIEQIPVSERQKALPYFERALCSFLKTDLFGEAEETPIPCEYGKPVFSQVDADNLLFNMRETVKHELADADESQWFDRIAKDEQLKKRIDREITEYFEADYFRGSETDLFVIGGAAANAIRAEEIALPPSLSAEDRQYLSRSSVYQSFDVSNETYEVIKRELEELQGSREVSLFGKQFFLSVRYHDVQRILREIQNTYFAERASWVQDRCDENARLAQDAAAKSADDAEPLQAYRERDRVQRLLIKNLLELAERLWQQLTDINNHRIQHAKAYVKQYLFDRMSSVRKGFPCGAIREQNLRAEVRFVGIDDTKENASSDAIGEVVREIKTGFSDGDSISLLIDMQGGTRTNGFVLNSVLSVLSNDPNDAISVDGVFATNWRFSNYASQIVDETARYRISDLVAGMNAFLRYGKADQIKDYVDARSGSLTAKQKKAVNALVGAMVRIDEAISLCNIDLLTNAIGSLKTAVNSEAAAFPPLFSVLVEGIRKDYGDDLMTLEDAVPNEDTVPNMTALVEWCMKKHFYQQAATIIEAKFPKMFFDRQILYTDREQLDYLIDTYGGGRNNQDRNNPNRFNDYASDEHYLIKTYSTILRKRCRQSSNARALRNAVYAARNNNIFGDPDITIRSNCKKPDDVEKVFSLYFQIADYRNETNHANTRGDKRAEEIIGKINELLNLLNSVELLQS